MMPTFAQAVSSAFLIDPLKPALALAVAAAGASLTSRLAKDIKFCGMPSGPWHAKMIAGCAGLDATRTRGVDGDSPADCGTLRRCAEDQSVIHGLKSKLLAMLLEQSYDLAKRGSGAR